MIKKIPYTKPAPTSKWMFCTKFLCQVLENDYLNLPDFWIMGPLNKLKPSASGKLNLNAEVGLES